MPIITFEDVPTPPLTLDSQGVVVLAGPRGLMLKIQEGEVESALDFLGVAPQDVEGWQPAEGGVWRVFLRPGARFSKIDPGCLDSVNSSIRLSCVNTIQACPDQ